LLKIIKLYIRIEKEICYCTCAVNVYKSGTLFTRNIFKDPSSEQCFWCPPLITKNNLQITFMYPRSLVGVLHGSLAVADLPTLVGIPAVAAVPAPVYVRVVIMFSLAHLLFLAYVIAAAGVLATAGVSALVGLFFY
jgi:hypothetical protein